MSQVNRSKTADWLSKYKTQYWDPKHRIIFGMYGYALMGLESFSVKTNGEWTINVNYESAGKLTGKQFYLASGKNSIGEETIYIEIQKDIKVEEIINIYKQFYINDEFIKIKENGFSEIKDVELTNKVQLSFHQGSNGKLTIVSAIDNLLKGAAGQAVQNMNIKFGFNQNEGLT